MSKNKPPKKKKVVVSAGAKKRVTPTVSTRQTKTATRTVIAQEELLFGKQNYMLMAAGAGLIALGMILMMGGDMPDPNTWDPDIIYSFRRTVLAPFVILAGLVVEIYAIFKK